MALIVEDGTARADAESYCSVNDANTYHTARGNAAWAALASDAIREQCLRKATDYMMQTFRGRWKGFRYNNTQALDWPRQSVLIEDAPLNAWVPYTEVPTAVKNACAELALRAATADLNPDLERTQSKVTVGPITVEYDPTAPESPRYVSIPQMLRAYLLPTGGMLELVRC